MANFFRSISSSCISSLLISPGTMTSLPDCELHLSIHVRLVGYTHKTIHILHQLLFITLSVTNVICDFECFITLLFPCIAHFHFIIVLFLFWNLAVFITCYWNIKLTYLLLSNGRFENSKYSETERCRPARGTEKNFENKSVCQLFYLFV